MSKPCNIKQSLGVICTATGIALLSATPVRASSFSIENITGTWNNVQGTSYFNGTGTDQVRWGSPATSAGQSGFDFEGSFIADNVFSGSSFVIGELTHLNFPVYSASSGVDFALSMEVDGTLTEFDYSFVIDETDNTAGTCSSFQISDTPCDDRILFSNSSSQTSFAKNGFNYSLELSGFSETADGLSPVSSFITEERKASSAFLVARIVKDSAGDVSVPEPTSTLALLSVGILASRLRRRS